MLGRLRLAAVAAAALALAIPAGAGATWPGKARHVFYCNGELHRVRPDGTHDRTLARDTGGGCDVAVTRRGNEVAYAGKHGLIRMRADGTHKRVVLGPASFSPWIRTVAWSPDARRIAFTAVTEEDNGHDEIEEVPRVYVARRNGTHVRALGRGSSPVWSPHGHHLFFAGSAGAGKGGIVRSTPRGKHRQLVVPGGSPPFDLAPSGRKLVYETYAYDPQRGGLSFVNTLDLRTGRHTIYDASYDTDRSDVDLAWTPRGRRISFSAIDQPFRTVRPDGTDARELFEFAAPFPSPLTRFAWQTGRRR